MPPHEARNPVVLFANALGDCVMALPTLRALAAAFAGRLHLVLAEAVPDALLGGLGVRRVSRIAMQATGTGRHFDPERMAAICGEADLLVAPVPWSSGSMRAFLARSRPHRSVGFFPGFTDMLRLDFGKHSADLTFDVVRHLWPGATPEPFAGPVKVAPEAAAFVRRMRRMLGGAGVLVAHNETKPDKRLPDAVFAAMLRDVAARRPDWAVIALGHARSGLEEAPEQTNLFSVTGLPLGSAVALIASADLFVGVDSFPLHVADLARVSGIGLFGPTAPHEFGFRFGEGCALSAPDMASFRADAIADAVLARMRQPCQASA